MRSGLSSVISTGLRGFPAFSNWSSQSATSAGRLLWPALALVSRSAWAWRRMLASSCGTAGGLVPPSNWKSWIITAATCLQSMPTGQVQ